MNYIFLLLCLIASKTIAQDIATVDSLLIHNKKGEAGQAQAYKALELAKQFDYNKGEARAYHMIGYNYFLQNNYNLALDNYFLALRKSMEAGDEERFGHILNQCAELFLFTKHYQRAQNFADSSYKFIKSPELIYAANSNKAKAVFALGRLDESEDLYRQNIDLKSKNNDQSKIGLDYQEMGLAATKTKEYDKALKYFELAKEAAGTDAAIQTQIHINVGYLFHIKGDLKSARKSYLNALSFNYPAKRDRIYFNLAELEHQAKNTRLAIEYLVKGKLSAASFNHLDHLGYTLEQMGNIKESLQVYKRITEKMSADLEHANAMNYRLSLIEKEVEHLKNKETKQESNVYKQKTENYKNYLIIAAIVILLLLAVVIVLHLKLIKKNEIEYDNQLRFEIIKERLDKFIVY